MASHPRWPYRPLPNHNHRAQSRNLAVKTLCALAVAAVAVLIAAPAKAEPSISAVEKQIDEAWNKIEPIIERHNSVRVQLAAKRKKANELNKRIGPLSLQVDLAMNQVTAVAARKYKGGDASAFNALLTSGSPAEFTDQMAMLDQFAKHQRRQIKSVMDLKARYDAEKTPLDQLVAQLSAADTELAGQEKQINADIKRLQDLRLRLYGAGGGDTGALKPAPCPYSFPGGAAGKVVSFGCKQIGKMYQWGASGPSRFDCSGFTMAAWAQGGVSLPHNAAAQRRATKSVPRSQLRAGDLVFYYSDLHHVGLYVGGGWIVHASRAGEPIKMKRVDDGPIHSYGRPG